MPVKNPFQLKPFTFVDLSRLLVAIVLLVALLGFLIAYCALAFHYANLPGTPARTESWDLIKDAFQVILPIVTGLLGSAVAFYFAKDK